MVSSEVMRMSFLSVIFSYFIFFYLIQKNMKWREIRNKFLGVALKSCAYVYSTSKTNNNKICATDDQKVGLLKNYCLVGSVGLHALEP